MYRNNALQRSLRSWLHHLSIYLSQYSTYDLYQHFNSIYPNKNCTHRVLPIVHSTHPKSCPNVRIGCLSSSGRRPSRRKPCLSAAWTNSFSGIEGDGGRGMVVGGELQENLNAHIAGGIHDPDAYHFGYVRRDEISATLTFTLTFVCTYLSFTE